MVVSRFSSAKGLFLSTKLSPLRQQGNLYLSHRIADVFLYFRRVFAPLAIDSSLPEVYDRIRSGLIYWSKWPPVCVFPVDFLL